MSVRFQVNGQEVEVEVEPRLTLADCLRHHLRLTGTHVGCEHGVCGACTVIVDGAAVRSCLMLAVQAEGAQIVTVEGLSNDADLTPLQKAFRKHHALQCGFCTPGMITTAHALLSEEPDCDAARVREVLSGNLCRCTGYISIVEAVLDARAAYQPEGQCEGSRMRTVNSLIGSPIERLEDLRFLRGRGQYVDDLARKDMLHAAILRSSVAHGRIRSIAVAAARALPGVHSVITAKDIGNRVPRVPMRLQPLPDFEPFGQPVIAETKVRYVGEALAVVLADSPGIAEDALGLIEVEIEPLPAVADRQASAQDASLLFEDKGTNLAIKFRAVRGDAAAAFTDAPYVRRESFRTQRHMALPLEPRGLLAEWDAARGRLTLSGGAKVLFFNRRTLAKAMGLPESAIEIVENDVGGGFGARGEFYPEDFLIPFAARHTGRPVKWTEDRREHLMCMNHAREAECDVEIACRRDGTILGLRGHAYVDVGAYMRTNGAVGARNVAQFMSGPYRIPHIDIDVALQLTNKTPVGTYRGPGRFETDFFRERLFDMVAQDLGLDRVEFRRRNLVSQQEMPYRIATITPFESKDEFDSGDYHATLDRCLDEIKWTEKVEARGQADRGPLSRPCRRLLHRGRRRRTEGERTHRARAGWTLFGLCRVIRHRPGAGDGLRADRRRRARSDDRPHPRRLSRQHLLCGRRLRRLSLAFGGDGRLRDARCREEPARSDPRAGGAASGLRAGRGRDRRRQQGGRARRQVRRLERAFERRHLRRRRLPQQEAHLYLRRPRRPCGGRCQARPRGAHRLRGGRGLRAHHQSA